MYEPDERVAATITKCVNHFLKAFFAQDSPHRSSKGLVTINDGKLVNRAEIAFSFSGSYQACDSFRSSLYYFCSIHNLTLDRGFEIYCQKPNP